MPRSFTFDCTQAQFEAIHAALSKLRKGSKTATVDRAALEALLRDHSRLIALHKAEG